MFAEYQPQQYVKLVANEDYFRGAENQGNSTISHPMQAATWHSSLARLI